MEKYYYLVAVEAAVPEQADEVIAERLNHDEFLGFDYSIGHKMLAMEPTRWWRVLDKDGQLWCETSSESEARQSMLEWDEKREERTKKKTPGVKLQRLYKLELDPNADSVWKDME